MTLPATIIVNTSPRHNFTERLGPSQEDFDAVFESAKANGLTVTGGSRDSMDIQMTGSAGAVERAFHVQINLYQHPNRRSELLRY